MSNLTRSENSLKQHIKIKHNTIVKKSCKIKKTTVSAIQIEDSVVNIKNVYTFDRNSLDIQKDTETLVFN